MIISRPSDRKWSSTGVATEFVKLTQTEELGDVGSREEGAEEEEVVATSSSWPRQGILKNNLKLNIKDSDLFRLRYFYKIPKSVEIRAPSLHERVD